MRPEYVRNFEKPEHTAIKEVNGHWYLYRVRYEYDKEKKRTKTRWGEYLGRIDEEGFHPKRTEAGTNVAEVDAVAEVGATAWCFENTPVMRERLERIFPKYWKMIYVTALLQAVGNDRLHRLGTRYRDSVISRLLPGVTMSSASLSRMLKQLGAQRKQMKAYMEEDLSRDTDYLLIDGHRVLSAAEDMETARLGYDTKKRFKLQINLMYMFSLSKAGLGMPVYFEQFGGDEVDATAVPTMLESVNILPSRCLVVADKGCASEKTFRLLDDHGLYYCMPIKRNNRFTKGKIPSNGGYEQTFLYRDRPIQCSCFSQKGFNVFLFFDIELCADETASLTRRYEKQNEKRRMKRQQAQKQLDKIAEDLTKIQEKGQETEVMAAKRSKLLEKKAAAEKIISQNGPIDISAKIAENPAMGTIAIRTNQTNLTGPEVYRIYKQRIDIEAFFKTYTVTLGDDASWMRNEQTMQAWLFLNHLSAQITAEAMNMIEQRPMKGSISWDDMRRALSTVRAILSQGKWYSAPVDPDVQRICARLGIDPYDLSLLDTV